MPTRFISLLPAVMLALLGVPAHAYEDLPPAEAEKKLRICLVTGSSAAPDTGLREAVLSVRAYCAPQIKRVRAHRVEAATAGLEGKAAEAAEDRAIRALNDEIALAISNFTGLTLNHAEHR